MYSKSSLRISSYLVSLALIVLLGVFYPNYTSNAIAAETDNPTLQFFQNAIDKAGMMFGLKKLQDGNAVGALNGKLHVTPTGQAQYSIPITLPPGTNKMEPVLSFKYDSTGGNTHNSLLGMGFSLTGLTSIARCSSDIYHNGKIHGVDYSDEDRFNMGGEQLVAVKGEYGQDGTEYRTYNDTQTRIISHGRQGNGPAYFSVETKGGLISYYGNSPDSQNKAQGKDSVAVWGLNKTQDRSGNYFSVTYLKDDVTNGTFYPIQVDYTGNDNAKITPYNSIKLGYEDRLDVDVSYQAGSKITVDKRLKTLQVLESGNTVYNYTLTYEQSDNTERSRLTTIQKCDGGGNCLPPTQFGWQANDAGWEETDITLPAYLAYYDSDEGKNSNTGVKFVDVNGDGLLDIIQNVRLENKLKKSEYKYGAWLNTGNGWSKNSTASYVPPDLVDNYNYGLGDASDNGFRITDIDGDGVSDIARAVDWNDGSDKRNDVWLNNGTTWDNEDDYKLKDHITYYKGGSAADNGDNGFRFVDLNGNGLPDSVRTVYWDGKTSKNDTWINDFQNGNGWQEDATHKLPAYVSYFKNGAGKASDNGFRFIDLNGDTLPDIIRSVHWDDKTEKNDAWINTADGWVSNGNYTVPSPAFATYYGGTTSNTNGDYGFRFVDLNGDGLPDIVFRVWLKKETFKAGAWLNTGAGWKDVKDDYEVPDLIAYYSYSPGIASDNGFRFADLNGDGKADVISAVNWNAGDDKRNGAWLNSYSRDPVLGKRWKKEDGYKFPSGGSYPDSNYIVFYSGGSGTYNGDNGVRLLDINGSGLPDLVQAVQWKDKKKQQNRVWLNKAKKLPDYLISITDGLGVQTTIDYEPLSGAEVKVYDQERNPDGSLDSHYPNPQYSGPMYVVYQTASATLATDPTSKGRASKVFPQSRYSTVPADDGLQHITTYQYAGARKNRLGLGFLGFHKVTTTDNFTGISKTTAYGQDPDKRNVGKVLSTQTHTKGGTLIHSMSKEWGFKTFGGGEVGDSYYLPFAKTVTEKAYGLDGGLLNTKTIDMSFDDYANPLQVINTVVDVAGNSYSTLTANTHETTIDAAHWIPGRLKTSAVTASATGTASETHSSSFVYDDNGLLASEITEPDDTQYTLTKTYTRDGFGNIIKTEVTNADKSIDQTTTSTYDARGQFVISATNELGQETSQTVDKRFGLPLTKTDLNGLVTTYHYDGFSRPINQTNPDGTQININYYWVTNPVAQAKDAVFVEQKQLTGKPDSFQYFDMLKRTVAKSTTGFNSRPVWQVKQYNEVDLVTRASLSYFDGDQEYYTTHDYDVLGRVIKTIKADGSVIQMVHDGLTTKTINQLEQATTRTVDVRGNVIKSTDNAGKSITYKYDAFGRLLSMTDSKGNVSTMTYDKFGHKLTQNDPDKGKFKYTYDVLGRMLDQTNAGGDKTIFTYDKLGRVISRTDGVGTSTWVYGNDKTKFNVGHLISENGVANLEIDSKGEVKVVEANAIDVIKARRNGLQSYSKTMAFDKYSRPSTTTTTIDTKSYVTKAEYDDKGRISRTTYPNGFAVQNIYNPIGYLSAIKDATGAGITYWQLNAMDASGKALSEMFNDKFVANKTYDPKTEFLTRIQTSFDSTSIQDLNYTYDTLGNVQTRTDVVNNINETFKYNDGPDGTNVLNRLTDWNATGNIIQTAHYDYDELGNMIYQSGIGHYVYGENAGPHAVSSINDDQGSQVGKFSYDANGNQINSSLNGVSRNITYTSYEKPLEISGDVGTANFYYDANRNQFVRTDHMQQAGQSMSSTLVSLGSYQEENSVIGKTSVTKNKIYIGPYAEVEFEITKDGVESSVYGLLKDSLGSITDIVDTSGTVLQKYHFTPFGKRMSLGGTDPNNMITHEGFTGHQEVEAFGLIHMKGRIYDPVLGRFLSADPSIQDPMNTQSLNRYSYCLNNPLAYTDPTGFSWWNDLIHDIGHLFHEVFHAIESVVENRYFQIAVAIALSFTGMPVWALMLAEGAYSGFNTAIAGGSIGQIMESAFIAAASAEFGAATKGLGGAAFGTAKWGEDVALHGLENGAISSVEGGSFADGFLSGAVMQAVQAPIGSIAKKDWRTNAMLLRATADGLVGGSVAVATGGSFADAAKTSAFSYLCSEDFSLTASLGKGSMSLEKAKKEYPGRSFIVARKLDLPIISKLSFILYPFVHTAMYTPVPYKNAGLNGLRPQGGHGLIPGFSGPANVYDDGGKGYKYVVLNVQGFPHGFDASGMAAIQAQESVAWGSSSSPQYNFLLHDCHDYSYDLEQHYRDRYGSG